MIEADLRLARGRIEVRHARRLGPLPVHWDRWWVRVAGPRFPVLADLLAATAADAGLVLDLKGRQPRLGALVAEALNERRSGSVTVCARRWDLLRPFEGLPVCRVASVGSHRQLRTLLARFRGATLDGVSIHERLLDERSTRELRQIAGTILSWPVNRVERALELIQLGVQGLITDDPDALATPLLSGAAR